ncbi:MAG TPA: hypothetical protein VN222_05965 [Novosphingobium sp.]|nr:hypothetical protein [Novosphingobium sp.]
MLTTMIAAMALAGSPVAVAPAAALTPCNPQPSKSLGCYRTEKPSLTFGGRNAAKASNAATPREAEADAPDTRQVACHPDPSRNRGCLRPAPDA